MRSEVLKIYFCTHFALLYCTKCGDVFPAEGMQTPQVPLEQFLLRILCFSVKWFLNPAQRTRTRFPHCGWWRRTFAAPPRTQTVHHPLDGCPFLSAASGGPEKVRGQRFLVLFWVEWSETSQLCGASGRPGSVYGVALGTKLITTLTGTLSAIFPDNVFSDAFRPAGNQPRHANG